MVTLDPKAAPQPFDFGPMSIERSRVVPKGYGAIAGAGSKSLIAMAELRAATVTHGF